MSVESILNRKRWIFVGVALLTLLICYQSAISGSTSRATIRRIYHHEDAGEEPLTQDATPSQEVAYQDVPSSKSPQHGQPGVPPRNLDGDFFDSLTTEQCHQYFPKLYKDIDDRVAFWKKRNHTITEDDLNISWRDRKEWGGGAMRIMIHDNQIRITEAIGAFGLTGFHERGLATLALLQRAMNSAVAAGEMLPSIEVAILLDDIAHPPDRHGNHSFWAFAAVKDSEEHKRRWLIPNFNNMFAMPLSTYQDTRRRAKQHDAPFSAKIQQAVWRGTPALNPPIRDALMNATRGKYWANVKGVYDGPSQRFKMTADEYCEYAMTIHTEGISYSGRLHDLLHCNSLVFVHDLVWFEHWQHVLQDRGPEQNYVAVNRTFEDLEEKVKYFMKHPREADRIINNAVNTVRNKYMTQAADSCYLRALIRGYASVAFKPQLYQPLTDDRIKRLRGMPYDIFHHYPRNLNETLLRKWELDALRE